MMKKSLISICVVSVFLLSGLVLAGIDPEPFIGQLGAVENILNSADNRISKVMGIDPTPFEPSPALIGAVNRLGAMERQLWAADDMVQSIAEEVAGVDPEPFIPAFTAVGVAAQGIDVKITAFLRSPPDDIMPEFVTALVGVQGAAQDIVGTVNLYLEPPSDCGACAENPIEADCIGETGCSWVVTDPSTEEGYCCTD